MLPSFPLFYTDDDQADAHRILTYTIANDEPPAGLASIRYERAEALAIVANARREDEDPRTVDTIATAKGRIARAARRAKAIEAELEREQHQADQADQADDQADTMQPQQDSQDARIVAGLAELMTAALALALQRQAEPHKEKRRPQTSPARPNAKNDDDDDDGGRLARLQPQPKTDPRGPNSAAQYVTF